MDPSHKNGQAPALPTWAAADTAGAIGALAGTASLSAASGGAAHGQAQHSAHGNVSTQAPAPATAPTTMPAMVPAHQPNDRSSTAPRGLDAVGVQRALRQAQDRFAGLAPTDLAPQRRNAAQRLLRAFLSVRGILDYDEPLSQVRCYHAGHPAGAYHEPRPHAPPDGSGTVLTPAQERDLAERWVDHRGRSLLAVLRAADALPPDEHGATGLPLMPPLVPARYMTTGSIILPTYQANAEGCDQRLQLYVDACEIVADVLQLDRPRPDDPHAGGGLLGLLDPLLCRAAWPRPTELELTERLMAQDAVDAYVRGAVARGSSVAVGGFAGVRARFADRYGFTDEEVAGCYAWAKQRAQDQLGDLVGERALLVQVVQDLARRARDRGDLVRELAAVKLQALVAGFARVEPDDVVTIFAKTVERVTAEDERRPQRPVVKMLDAPLAPEAKTG